MRGNRALGYPVLALKFALLLETFHLDISYSCTERIITNYIYLIKLVFKVYYKFFSIFQALRGLLGFVGLNLLKTYSLSFFTRISYFKNIFLDASPFILYPFC